MSGLQRTTAGSSVVNWLQDVDEERSPPLQAIDLPKVWTRTSVRDAKPYPHVSPRPLGPYNPVEWACAMSVVMKAMKQSI